MYQEILEEYLLSYNSLEDKLKGLCNRIETLASDEVHAESIHKIMSCFLGIKTHFTLSVITETEDSKRFVNA